MMSTATIHEDGEVFHFASLDGENFIEVERPVERGEEEALAAAFEGNGGRTLPLSFGRGFLRSRRAAFASV